MRNGQVRELDRDGNNRADEAADFGRRRVWPDIIDARRNLSGVCGHWYAIVKDLHRFFVAISRAVVNADGHPGLAPYPLVDFPRGVGLCVQSGMLLCFLGLLLFGNLGGWEFFHFYHC